MSATAEAPAWGRSRKLFWPIKRNEYRKFIPMLFIYSLIVFNYSILKAAKDALVITAPGSGASAIPYIKLWAILPMAFLSTLIFTRLSNKYSRDRVFYFMMMGFLGFFFVFAFFLYPLRDVLHPHMQADYLQSILPTGMQGLVAIFRNWTFTLFYVMCELWGTIIMTVLFWGFANEVTSVTEAKRFYAILGVGANIGTILAGRVGIFLSGDYLYQKFSLTGDKWGHILMMTTTLILIVGILSMFLYRKLTHNIYHKEIVDSTPLGDAPPRSKGAPKTKIKMGMRKNFSYLANSKYLICIAVIVLTYNISLNMIEVVWKDQVHHLYSQPADYNIYMNKVLTYIGILSTIFSIFICGQVIRKFGWSKSAYLTPVIMLVTGFLFFSFIIFKDVGPVAAFSTILGTTPLLLATFFGSIQNCLARSSKFTFFDVTKEMAFIPLSNESKLKGKAAIDGVGSRIGKSGGSLIHQCLLVFFGTISLSTPFVAGILFIVIIAWLIAVRSLGKQFAAQPISPDEKIEPLADDLESETAPAKGSTQKEPALG